MRDFGSSAWNDIGGQMKRLTDFDLYFFKPQRQFFIAHLRFSTLSPLKLMLFILGLSFLALLMLANDNYLINFLAVFLIVPLGSLIETVSRNTPKILSFKTQLLRLMSESFLYIGALLHNAINHDIIFTFFAALSLLGLWLQYELNERKHIEIKMLPLEFRFFALAALTLLTLNFIYFLIFVVLIYGQIFIHAQAALKQQG